MIEATKTLDYYEFLQISPHADTETIHRVYRYLAARFHPDNLHDVVLVNPLPHRGGHPQLEVRMSATGKVTAAPKPRHRHSEFLAFLKQVERAYPPGPDAGQLHLVMDNYAAHKHPKVKAWLAEHPRIHVHFTPTHASWMNLVEAWFSLAEGQAIHRGTYTSVKDLNAKIRAYVDGWNNRAHPFNWTKTADQILTKANSQKISNAEQ